MIPASTWSFFGQQYGEATFNTTGYLSAGTEVVEEAKNPEEAIYKAVSGTVYVTERGGYALTFPTIPLDATLEDTQGVNTTPTDCGFNVGALHTLHDKYLANGFDLVANSSQYPGITSSDNELIVLEDETVLPGDVPPPGWVVDNNFDDDYWVVEAVGIQTSSEVEGPSASITASAVVSGISSSNLSYSWVATNVTNEQDTQYSAAVRRPGNSIPRTTPRTPCL